MTNLLPEGALINVGLVVRLPAAATREQIQEWLAVELASWPTEIMADNPLCDEPVVAFAPDDVRFLDTGEIGNIVEGAGPANQPWPDLYLREPRR
jgi:hypothetical protein